MNKLILNFDESGNLGRKGRYFTIACVEASNVQPIKNVMKKGILKVKKEFPRYAGCNEIKASDSSPPVKDYLLRKILSKDIEIRYIVADLHHTKQELIDDENLLYNYMLQFLIIPAARKPGINQLEINIDKRTIKVKSVNSFQDYIKVKLNYEMNLNVDVKVNYFESHNSYAIQAADFVANIVNSYYEYKNNHYFYEILKEKVCQRELFPRHNFGKLTAQIAPREKIFN